MSLFLLERDPKERGLNYIVKMKMPPEGALRAAVLQVPRAFRAVSLRLAGGGGRGRAVRCGLEGGGHGEGEGVAGPKRSGAGWACPTPDRCFMRSHLNPGEQTTEEQAEREME